MLFASNRDIGEIQTSMQYYCLFHRPAFFHVKIKKSSLLWRPKKRREKFPILKNLWFGHPKDLSNARVQKPFTADLKKFKNLRYLAAPAAPTT